MKLYTAVLTGFVLSLTVFNLLLHLTDCSLGILFTALCVAYIAGIAAIALIPERRKVKND